MHQQPQQHSTQQGTRRRANGRHISQSPQRKTRQAKKANKKQAETHSLTHRAARTSVGISQRHRVIAHHCIKIQAIDLCRRVRADPALQPRRVVPQTVVIQPAGIAFLARIAKGFVTGLDGIFRGPPGSFPVGVKAFLAEQHRLFIQFQGATAGQVRQGEAQLLVVDSRRAALLPLQGPDRRAPGFNCQHIEPLAGGVVATQLQARQINHFAQMRHACSLAHAALEQPLAVGVVRIALGIRLTVFTEHLAYLRQLVAQVPAQGLARCQRLLVAAAVEAHGLALDPGMIAVRGHGHAPGVALTA